MRLEIFVPAGALGALKTAADAHRQFEDKVNEARALFEGGDTLKLSPKAHQTFATGRTKVIEASAYLRGAILVAAEGKWKELTGDPNLTAGVAELTAKADSSGNIKSEAHVESAKPVEPPPAQESAWQEQEDEGSDDPLPPAAADHKLPAEGIIRGTPPSLEAQAMEHQMSMRAFRANLYSAAMDRLIIAIDWIERNNATVQEILGATVGVIGQLPKFLQDLASLYIGNDPGFKIALSLIKRNPDMAEGRSMSWWHPDRINGMLPGAAADSSGTNSADDAAADEGDATAAEPKKKKITNKVLFDAISDFLKVSGKKAGILPVLELFKKRSWSDESWQKHLSSAPGESEKYISECLHACYDSTQPKVIFETHVDDLVRKVNELEDDAPLAAIWKALAYHRRDLDGKSAIPEEFQVPRPAPAAQEPGAAVQSEAPAGESKEDAAGSAADAGSTQPGDAAGGSGELRSSIISTLQTIKWDSDKAEYAKVISNVITYLETKEAFAAELIDIDEAVRRSCTFSGGRLSRVLRKTGETFTTGKQASCGLRCLLKKSRSFELDPKGPGGWFEQLDMQVLTPFVNRLPDWKLIYQPDGGDPEILFEGDTYTPLQVRVATLSPEEPKAVQIRSPGWEPEWALKANADAAAADDLENAEEPLLADQKAEIETAPGDMDAAAEANMLGSADAGVMTSGSGTQGAQV